jgi:sugar phosphate isomerase/epimerase
MSRLSLSHLTVLEVGPPDLVTLAADAGFSSLGIRLHPPMPGGTAYPLRPGSPAMIETRRRMADRGVDVFDVEVVRLAEETEVQAYAAMFDAAAELGAKRVCVNVDDPDRSRAIDRFAELCDLAMGSNLGVDLEFMIWRPVARIEDAAEIVRAAAKPNAAILIDALHLFRSGGNVSAVAGLDPALIGSVQLCDAAAEAPSPSGIIDEARSNRLPPGEGALPLSALLAALPEAVMLGLEVPMSCSPSMSPLERARRVYQSADVLLRARPLNSLSVGTSTECH